MQIDLNADLGESYGPWSMGDDAAMLKIVTSANIACGGHASDPETMFESLLAASANGVSVGAHPGYNDREGFGRRIIPMPPEQIGRLIITQIGALQAMAKIAGTRVAYVKPHGALANLAAADRSVAEALVSAISALDPTLPILAISGTQVEQVCRNTQHPVYSEIFADRAYQPSGQLVPRSQAGAVITDADQAVDRLLSWLKSGLMPTIDGQEIPLTGQSICIHGDSPHAVAMAQALHSALTAEGVSLAAFVKTP